MADELKKLIICFVVFYGIKNKWEIKQFVEIKYIGL